MEAPKPFFIMPCTEIQYLEPNTEPNPGIVNGPGSKATYGALYYYDDIKRVMEQDETATINKLVNVNVKFPKIDTAVLFPDITVLALLKDAAASDINNDDNTENQRYHTIVALPWPSHYIRNDNSGTENFPGEYESPTYKPGVIITNGL